MENRNCVLEDKEEASSVFTAVDMDVSKIDTALARFAGYVGAETLRKNSFACANVACYHDPLSHLIWRLKRETEELIEQTQFPVSMWKLVGNVVDIKLCFVSKHALIWFHLVGPQISRAQSSVTLFLCASTLF
jgi:hypothetical protein